MKRTVLVALALAGGADAQAQWRESSYANIGGWQTVQSWCDTPRRMLALSFPKRAASLVTLVQWNTEPGMGGQLTARDWQLGLPDAGAGQIYTPLIPLGQAQDQARRRASNASRDFIHSSNVENTDDPHYRMTHINAYVVPAGRFQCRYVPQATVLAATAKHSVIVWEAQGRVTYASRNRDGTPGIQLTGGAHTASGRERYVWTNAGYEYVLQLGQAAQPGGSLSVLRGRQVLSREELLAYSLSVAK
ncbi:hypothetical protein [Deinococcus frigens]|uniref:hypothetical protein n=1 Tax=Deinococcus frigens TaxID=249403 RepID=UPI000495FFA3|nr:hypothetical protein [Deinococcus frigens]